MKRREDNGEAILPGKAILFARSFAFWIVFLVSIVLWSLVILFMAPFSFETRSKLLVLWSRFTNWWLLKTCKLGYEIQGTENIPEGSFIILSKHQSTWETISLQMFFPRTVWVAKRELLWLPFFGWAFAAMEPIALDRSAGRRAVEQLVRDGTTRLKRGRCVVIFPEGTRTAPGTVGRYRIGGAVLAEQSAYPVVPIAHNAGEYWPRREFIKKPGTIRVRIGPTIQSQGKLAQEILAETQHWIEETMKEISTY